MEHTPEFPDSLETVLTGTEPYDASEPQFAAGPGPASPKPHFEIESEKESTAHAVMGATQEPPACQTTNPAASAGSPQHESDSLARQSEAMGTDSAGSAISAGNSETESSEDDSWRGEVTARVKQYRARRRPQAPRYPSLQLKFQLPPPQRERQKQIASPSAFPLAAQPAPPETVTSPHREMDIAPSPTPIQVVPDGPARIIEFPRSFHPPSPDEELAEPVVFTRPRILEVPEVAPAAPALGGVMIEPAQEPERKRIPGIELPLQPALPGPRFAAAAIDLVIVLAGVAGFLEILFRLSGSLPPIRQTIILTAAAAAILWAAYQFLLLVFSGTTVGLRIVHLDLRRFDDSPVPRGTRRWRALASFLSVAALGLGYAWCFLDEDQLCWHDRITGTYLAPSGSYRAQSGDAGNESP